MDQVKFVEDSLQKIWSDMVYLDRFAQLIFSRWYLVFLIDSVHTFKILKKPQIQLD